MYDQGPVGVTDEGWTLYTAYDTKKNLYLAKPDGTCEKLLINCEEAFGGRGIVYVRPQEDSFFFIVTSIPHNGPYGIGSYHLPSDSYAYYPDRIDPWFCDKEVLLFSEAIPTVVSPSESTAYSELEDKQVLSMASANARYLFEFGTQIDSHCVVRVFDRETGALSETYYLPEGLPKLGECANSRYSPSCTLTDDGAKLLYLSEDILYILNVDWSN
jgi:hypothetical protein